MKAIVCTKYGSPDVLQLREIQKPVPKDDEVLIRIYASAVTASDTFIRGFKIPLKFRIPMRIMMGITKPRKPVIGLVLAGEIESAGKNIKRFKPGDQVYGLTGFGLGAYAEYKCMKETDSKHGCLALKPATLSYEEATVAAYGGLLAFQFMEKGNIRRGHKVLIYGASGTTGTTAIQYASYLGAKITCVCSTTNLELVKSLGADEVIDYTKEDSLSLGAKYDFILDAVGKSKTSKLKEVCKKALASDGKYVTIDDEALLLDSNRLNRIRELAEAGFLKPFIDRIYKMEEIAEAHRYVEKGHKRGGVVIEINRAIS
ncbi:MAG: NAD(P)-dependent alcohol dehydrogenase [Bacteroidetes bacterium]|nr:NAD(P)-dependent alcohol dehydrogenase [Bacteroidota bacterium]